VAISLLLLLVSCGGGGGGGGGGGSEPSPDPIPQGNLSIGGTISVAAALAVDMDTNDPNAPPPSTLDNDFPYDDPQLKTNNFYNGQLLPNPGTVGGFVAFVGAGAAGPATGDDVNTTDWNDFYRVSLLAGQTISLFISDHIENAPLQNDLDLLLLDLDLNLIDVAAGTGPLESLVVPAAGEYFVWVSVCADTLPVLTGNFFICGDGASNYILSVGQGDTSATGSGLRLSSDFVPGEALVRYKKPLASENTGAGAGGLNATASSLGEIAPQVGNVRLLDFAAEPLIASATALALDEVPVETQPWISVTPQQRAKLATMAKIKELAGQPDIARAEPNYIRQPQFEPNDPGYQYQWHYPLINLPAAWDLFRPTPTSSPMGLLGANVTVAVLDTGILPQHPDIVGQIDYATGGYDFISSVSSAGDGNGPDEDPTDEGDSGFFGFSSSFHGTHVAGTIAAATNNIDDVSGNYVGVAGIAPDASILPVRVLGKGGGTSFDIRRGLCFAAGLNTGNNCAGVPVNANPADVINMSLGGADESLIEADLIAEVLAAGSIIVAAAGNSASSQPLYPAAYDGVVGVSAVTIDQSRAPYSSFGDFVDVAAPGGDTSRNVDGDPYADGVLSTGGDDAQGSVEYIYPFFQGTSMATPHVAGVFALMRSVNPALKPTDVIAMLEAGELTIPLGDISNGGRNDQFGYGLIDAQKAVSAALVGGSLPEPQPRLGVFPSALNFGATLDSLEITLRNLSGGDLTLLSIVSSESWLNAPPINGLTDYSVEVDRSGLVEGSYSATLTITSDANVVILPVIMQKSKVISGDAGHLYVRLIDPVTGNIREVETDVIDGKYVWKIDQLPPTKEGENGYQLVAYTDADNDNRVCDPGEACGSYLTVDQPIFIKLTEAQGNLMNLDYQINFGAALSDPGGPDKLPP
jgi:serine protease